MRRRKSKPLDKERETPERRYRYNPTFYEKGSPLSSIVVSGPPLSHGYHQLRTFEGVHISLVQHQQTRSSNRHCKTRYSPLTPSLTLYPAALIPPSSVADFAGALKWALTLPLAAEATGKQLARAPSQNKWTRLRAKELGIRTANTQKEALWLCSVACLLCVGKERVIDKEQARKSGFRSARDKT
jgi:hypothetical protein